jgi:hypothetical protein
MRRIILMLITFLLLSPSQAQQFPDTYFAPYLSRYPAIPMAKTAEELGVRYFTLAFILNGGECSARWGGSAPLEMPFLHTDLQALRELGGDAIVSFGGYGGTELAEACTDVEALREQYQSVIDLYDFAYLDFDIEGERMKDTEEVDRRSEAIAMLEAPEGQELTISYTLPVNPTGLTPEGIYVLQSAIDYGVEVDVVNIMTMNFGTDYEPDEMGANTIEAANSLHEQLGELYPDRSDEELWQMIGLTPMVGLNDVSPQVFTPEDAQMITDFAVENNVRMLSMWSLDRDQSCISNMAIVDAKCSGIEQEKFEFARIFNTLTKPID